MKPTRFHDLTVTGRTQEGRDGACLTLAVPEDLRDTFAFIPGQYVTVRAVVDGEDIRRPYSLCSVPGTGAIQIGVKRVFGGRMSNYLNDLEVGATLGVMAPEGRFQAQGGADILLIAAGSGITPILSIAETALERDPEAKVTLVYGNRETASIMFLDRLSDLKDRHLGRLRAIHILSRERQDADLFNGRIDGGKLAALEEAGLIDPGHASGIYLCGPGGLIEVAEDHFQACG
ncbi:MAG: FAD-binding oxidoreductase, partial [Pseudomonadota bacterium]